jgi:hypothetical protein
MRARSLYGTHPKHVGSNIVSLRSIIIKFHLFREIVGSAKDTVEKEFDKLINLYYDVQNRTAEVVNYCKAEISKLIKLKTIRVLLKSHISAYFRSNESSSK